MPRLRHNFSGGPGALPITVLEQARQALDEVPEVGLPVLGISHRSAWFRAVLDEAEQHLRALLGLEPDWQVLFLQGGSTLQFAAIPLLLARPGRPGTYLHTGYWSGKAVAEAQRVRAPHQVLWSGAAERFARLPRPEEVRPPADAAYLHWVNNETVEGLRFPYLPAVAPGTARVVDMSSDFLCQDGSLAGVDLVYAHAQKNLGPAGVTVVLIRDRLLRDLPDGLPSMIDWRVHVADRSIHNTPPVFAIYVTLLVLRWLRHEVGGLAAMGRINRAKAAALYAALDRHPEFYRTHVAGPERSPMNVAFRLPTPALEQAFMAEAASAGLAGLDGHRSLGGLRASLYNAVAAEGVDELCALLERFHAAHGG